MGTNMSTLSETLERCLRQIQKPTATAKVTAYLPFMVRSESLYFKEGTSDKEYHIQITQVHPAVSEYLVNFQYGRRGNTLKSGSKTEAPVTLGEAEAIYDLVVREKIAKGYRG